MFNRLTIAEAEQWAKCFPEGWKFKTSKTPDRVLDFGAIHCEYRINITIDRRELKCPAFSVWAFMLRRVLGEVSQGVYDGVDICPTWLDFENFARWYFPKRLQYLDSGEARVDVDKDILAAYKNSEPCYSPESCLVVPHKLNCFLNSNSKRPHGTKIGDRYRVHVGTKYLGYFDDVESANTAWKIAKFESIEELQLPNFWSREKCDMVRAGLKKMFTKKFGELNA